MYVQFWKKNSEDFKLWLPNQIAVKLNDYSIRAVLKKAMRIAFIGYQTDETLGHIQKSIIQHLFLAEQVK